MADPLDSLSATGWYEALSDAGRVLADHAGALDDMDDRGVGTDMAATLSGALSEVEGTGDMATVSAALSRGAKSAAVGTPGRHLATVLAAMGDSLANADRIDAERFAIALEAAAEMLAQSHDGRRPGRFAAVVSESADAALATCDLGAPLPDAVISAASAGIEELERGPESDPVLAERGTVDPAGAALLLVLDTIASVVSGEPLPERPVQRGDSALDVAAEIVQYDLSCRLIPDDGGIESAASIETVLSELGQLTTWDLGGDSWSVAMRTTLPGAAVEALVELGRPRDLRISVCAETNAQTAGKRSGAQPTGAPQTGSPQAGALGQPR